MLDNYLSYCALKTKFGGNFILCYNINMFKKKENFFHKIIFNNIFLSVIGLIVIVAISIPLAKNVSKQYEINNEVQNLKNEISNIEKKNSNLKDMLVYLESDQFIEEQARINLNYKKVGENLYVITDENKSENIKLSLELNKNKKTNNPIKWLNHFFNNYASK